MVKITYSLAPEFISSDDDVAELFNYGQMEFEIERGIHYEFPDTIVEFEAISSDVVPQRMFEVHTQGRTEGQELQEYVELLCSELDFSDSRYEKRF